jgi:heme exporter protein D
MVVGGHGPVWLAYGPTVVSCLGSVDRPVTTRPAGTPPVGRMT